MSKVDDKYLEYIKNRVEYATKEIDAAFDLAKEKGESFPNIGEDYIEFVVMCKELYEQVQLFKSSQKENERTQEGYKNEIDELRGLVDHYKELADAYRADCKSLQAEVFAPDSAASRWRNDALRYVAALTEISSGECLASSSDSYICKIVTSNKDKWCFPCIAQDALSGAER